MHTNRRSGLHSLGIPKPLVIPYTPQRTWYQGYSTPGQDLVPGIPSPRKDLVPGVAYPQPWWTDKHP